MECGVRFCSSPLESVILRMKRLMFRQTIHLLGPLLFVVPPRRWQQHRMRGHCRDHTAHFSLGGRAGEPSSRRNEGLGGQIVCGCRHGQPSPLTRHPASRGRRKSLPCPQLVIRGPKETMLSLSQNHRRQCSRLMRTAAPVSAATDQGAFVPLPDSAILSLVVDIMKHHQYPAIHSSDDTVPAG